MTSIIIIPKLHHASVTLCTYQYDVTTQYYPNQKGTKCGFRNPNPNYIYEMKSCKGNIFEGYILGLEFLVGWVDPNQFEVLGYDDSSRKL